MQNTLEQPPTEITYEIPMLFEQGVSPYTLSKLDELHRRDYLSDTYFDYDGYSFCHSSDASLLQRIEQWSRPSFDAYEDWTS